jgi:hypothetical protein
MCHRRPLLLLVPLVCLLVVVGGISNIDMIHGEFKTKDGSKCAWYELKESEDNVTIGIGCHCRTERGSGQGYTCHYFGDPSHCQAYSQDPRKFYTEIIEHIEGLAMVLFSFLHLPLYDKVMYGLYIVVAKCFCCRV